MRHIGSLVGPGGVFLTSALRRCRYYVVGGERFPSANVDEHDLRAVLGPDAVVETRELAEHAAQGYRGIVLASAQATPASIS